MHWWASLTSLGPLRLGRLPEKEILLVLSISTVFVMSGQGITGPLLPLYAKSFGVGATFVGLTISLFGLARMMINVPGGWVSDVFGRRLLLVGGPIVIAVASVLSGLATEFWQLLVWRFVAGGGSGLYMTGAVLVLAEISTLENRGRFMSIQQGGLLLGVTIGPAIGGLLAYAWGLRAPFFAIAGLAVVASIWNYFRIPETRGSASADPRGPVSLTANLPRSLRGLLAVATSATFLVIGLVNYSFFLTLTGSQQNVVPLLGQDRFGISAGSMGAIFTIMGIINLLVLFPAGSLADRFGRKRVIIPATLTISLGLFLFAVSGSSIGFLFAAVILAMGMGVAGPVPAAFAADTVPPRERGPSMGLFRTFGDAGFVVGPVLLGLITELSSFTLSLSVNAGIVLVSTLLLAIFAGEALPTRKQAGGRVQHDRKTG